MTLRSARGRRIALAVAVLVLVPAVLAGCSEAAKNNRQNSLEPKGPAAQTIDNLFKPIAVIAILVGIFIIFATVYVALKFRRRPGNENPKQVHGNTRLEIGWTIVPALILAIIAVPSIAAIFKLAENPGPEALQVTVVGKQWWWEFHYPDAKVVTADELIIPAGRPVFLKLSACETPTDCNVIHSFWVPELAGKKDVVPGHDNTLTIEADKPGTYLGSVRGVLRPLARQHAVPRDREEHLRLRNLVDRAATGPGAAAHHHRRRGQTGPRRRCAGPHGQHVRLRGLPRARGLLAGELRPEPHPPREPHRLRERLLPAEQDQPRELVAQRAGDDPDAVAGLPPPTVAGRHCVGMPSFTENTPKGQKAMTHDQAEQIADFLLGQT